MMSVSPGMAAGQAGGYFSREDYYLQGLEEGSSRWYGRGAMALGLDGPVGEEEFRALCRGEDPEGMRIVAPKLTRDRESERAQGDLPGSEVPGGCYAARSSPASFRSGASGWLARAPEVEAYLERWQEREGVRLTAGQKAEVLLELTGSRGVALTIGDPGTAKTSTLAIVERFNDEILRPDGREHLSVNLSYTGKAARELSLATGRPALTLDSFENGNPASKFALQRSNDQPPMLVVAGEIFSCQRGARRRWCSGWMRPAFSGRGRRSTFLDVAEELRQSGLPVKLHLLGDSKQLQGIQAGDLLRQVRELGLKEEVTTHI